MFTYKYACIHTQMLHGAGIFNDIWDMFGVSAGPGRWTLASVGPKRVAAKEKR